MYVREGYGVRLVFVVCWWWVGLVRACVGLSGQGSACALKGICRIGEVKEGVWVPKMPLEAKKDKYSGATFLFGQVIPKEIGPEQPRDVIQRRAAKMALNFARLALRGLPAASGP